MLYLWGGFANFVYSYYGITKGVKQDVARHVVHLCSTNRLQDLCFNNGRIYIKLGQHIGQLVCLLKVSKLWQNFNVLLVHCVTKRSYYTLWEVDEEVSEDVMVKMVTTLLFLKIYQHVCHCYHYFLEVHLFVSNLSIFLVDLMQENIYIYIFEVGRWKLCIRSCNGCNGKRIIIFEKS